MKNILILFALILGSCYPEGNSPEEKPEDVDVPATREQTGGAPDETTTQAISSFHSPDPNCMTGFGLCNVELAQPTSPSENQNIGDKSDNAHVRKYKATFYLSPGDQNKLRIEFDEEIPHYGTKFTVGPNDTLHNAFGHEFIVPEKGEYSTVKEKVPNGSVEINVIKGPKKSNYTSK
jgi:hypothetical protein